jgi:hypothetical protein
LPSDRSLTAAARSRNVWRTVPGYRALEFRPGRGLDGAAAVAEVGPLRGNVQPGHRKVRLEQLSRSKSRRSTADYEKHARLHYALDQQRFLTIKPPETPFARLWHSSGGGCVWSCDNVVHD